MKSSTVQLRNEAVRALANQCRMTPDEASALRCEDYRRTRTLRHPYLMLPGKPEESVRFAMAFLPARVTTRLDRYLARRERLTGIRPRGTMPFFLADCSTAIPRKMMPLEVAEVLRPRRRRA